MEIKPVELNTLAWALESTNLISNLFQILGRQATPSDKRLMKQWELTEQEYLEQVVIAAYALAEDQETKDNVAGYADFLELKNVWER